MDESVVTYLEEDMVSKVLARAARIMAERGLNQGDLFAESARTGSVCLQGALLAALQNGSARHFEIEGDGEIMEFFSRANDRLRVLLGDGHVPAWNDQEGRTQFEAVMLLSHAAALV